MKNMELLVLSALVIIGGIGIFMVMNAQTTGQLYYQIDERPPVLHRVLTTEKCELMQAKKHLGTEHCLTEGRATCNARYPTSPGGAENYCLQVCINKINTECTK